MSKIALSGDASGTGTFTIASPNSNNNRTLTIPDASGTLALQGGAGVGKVLQVVQATSGSVGTTSTSYTDVTGGSLSITPSSTSSKILVFVSGNTSVYSTGIEGRGYWRLQRNSTTLLNDQWTGYYFNPDITSDGNIYATISGCNLDSPSTTSATTYKIGFAAGTGVLFGGVFTVTALEIAA